MDVSRWREAIDDFLKCAKTVVQLAGQRTFLRGSLGEALTLHQLIKTYEEDLNRRGNRISYYGGQRKGYDILLQLDGREARLDCKEKTGQDWARNYARRYLKIEWDKGDHQHILGVLPPERDLFYVLVDSARFLDRGDIRFFALSDQEMKRVVMRAYGRWDGHRRPHSPKSTHFVLGVAEVSAYEDNQLIRWKRRLNST